MPRLKGDLPVNSDLKLRILSKITISVDSDNGDEAMKSRKSGDQKMPYEVKSKKRKMGTEKWVWSVKTLTGGTWRL